MNFSLLWDEKSCVKILNENNISGSISILNFKIQFPLKGANKDSAVGVKQRSDEDYRKLVCAPNSKF